MATGIGAGSVTPVTTTRSYDAANEIKTLVELTGTGGGSTTKNIKYTFDANGNRTQRYDSIAPLTTNYTYDQMDRLTSAGMYSYTYNGDGLRMSRSHSFTVNHFSWDLGVQAGLPLLLQDSTGASYVYGPGGMLLEDVVGTSSTDVYYYHGDRLGSVRALTSSMGAVSNTYSYDAYGKTLTSTGSVYNPFKYTGEYIDSETGFVYLRARYYDPESQQFLTVDPALAWTEEAYAYVGGSPTNSADPSGLLCEYGENPSACIDSDGKGTGGGGGGSGGGSVSGGEVGETTGVLITADGTYPVNAEWSSGPDGKETGETISADPIGPSGSEGEESGPECGIGEYKDVAGHHIHAKAGFRGAPGYDLGKALTISMEYMEERGWDHDKMTRAQRQLFGELERSGDPNDLMEHTRIAIEALMAGGASAEDAMNLAAKSLINLMEQGVQGPSRIPWSK